MFKRIVKKLKKSNNKKQEKVQPQVEVQKVEEKPMGIDSINNLPLIISSQGAEEIKLLKNTVIGLKINPIIESWTPESMLKLVREGNGVGFCQEDYIKDELENGSLKKLNVLFTLPKLDIYSGYVVDTLAFAPKKFVEFLSTKN